MGGNPGDRKGSWWLELLRLEVRGCPGKYQDLPQVGGEPKQGQCPNRLGKIPRGWKAGANPGVRSELPVACVCGACWHVCSPLCLLSGQVQDCVQVGAPGPAAVYRRPDLGGLASLPYPQLLMPKGC